ncbi:MAG: alpha-ketoacid dehydrogenase subunit beta [Chloroflexi bacterium]|nr:alpha-ketoacid dehydrogenase subunit beta [Chloroflexota bacterium]
MGELKLLDAVRAALQEEMRRDRRVILMGGDVRTSSSGLSAGLVEEFGEKRLVDMPIAEAAMAGMATGAAMVGLRPVLDLGNLGFSLTGMDQITNEGPKIHYKFNGQLSVPVVYLFQYAARGWGAQHDQAIYALLGHMPGLKIVLPSTPRDAKGLVKAAIRDDNPVAVCIALDLMASTGPVPDTDECVDIGTANILRSGADLSIFASGAMVSRALEAAGIMAIRGVSVEVVDVRSLVPLDWDTLTRSVRKTGRAIVLDQGHFTCGFAPTIAAGIQERAFDALKGPVLSVAALDVPVPYNLTLADEIVPTTTRLVVSIEQALQAGAALRV